MSTGIPTTYLIAFLLVMARVGAWLWLTPPFGGRMMPVIVRVLLSAALALAMTPGAVAASDSVPTSLPDLVGAMVVQIAIGAALGLACLTLISAVQAAGATIDVFGGFSLSQAFDPFLMQQSSVMARLYQLVAGVLLLVTGAHVILISAFATTFQSLPIDAALSLGATASTLTAALGSFFVATLQIAGPLIGVMVIADLGLGLLTRVAPSLNAFSLGFPLKIGLTLLLVGLSAPLLVPAVSALAEQAVAAMRAIAGG